MYRFLAVHRDSDVISLNTLNLVQQCMNTFCSFIHIEIVEEKKKSSSTNALIAKIEIEETKSIFRICSTDHLRFVIEIVKDRCLRILSYVLNVCI
jgi:hypothetical protein